jgi:hypothetical protein
MIRVTLPMHLRTLAGATGTVELAVSDPVTPKAILDALETAYPMLRGTIRDMQSGERRPFIRFFACGEDLSHEPTDTAVPPDVAAGIEPFRIIGAMAGG